MTKIIKQKNKPYFYFLTGILFLSLNQQSLAQQVFPPVPETQRPHIRAVYTSDKITIDGKPDEPAWQKAHIAEHFIVSYPKQGNKATYDTEVRILYDKMNLYIYAKCYFPPGKSGLQVQDMRRDFSFSGNELFEIVIDPFKDPRSPVMGFSVTPYGTQLDMMNYADNTFDYNWDAVWQAASSIQDHFWTTEVAIPFSSLRYPKNSTEWSINFVRNIRNIGELNGWSAWPKAFFESRMEYAGIVTDLAPPSEKLNLQFDPYFLANARSINKSAAGYKAAAGGEIKYAINSNTLLEGTIHTDFAQADADVEVINLTRSNVFLPEKRQFFLENASLFSVGQNSIIQPFFSRQIGLSNDGSPLTIDGGIRFTNQDSKEAAGLLVIKQKGDSTVTGALFAIFRYKRNVSKKLQVGGMVVLKEDMAGNEKPAYLNPVGVVDALWRINPSIFIRGMGSISGNSLTKQKGMAAFSEVNYSDNIFSLDWFETVVSKGYQAQAGYVQRANFINTQPTFGLNIYKDWFPKNISFYNPQLSANIYQQESTGIFQEADVNVIPLQLVFENLSQFNFNMTSAWENLTSPFSPVRNVNIAIGNYHYNRYEFYGTTNQAAHYSFAARVSTGGYYNGRLNSYYLSLRAEPATRFSLVMGYTLNTFNHTGIKKVNAETHLLAPELRLAVNPKILLSALYQYNTDARNGSLNARFTWEYKPLSYVYLVFNSLDNYYKTPFGTPQKQQNGILKLTYIYQL